MLLLLFATVFLIFSVPVSSVFLYLQRSCIFSVPVSSVFVYLQRRIEVDLTVACFLENGRSLADLQTSAPYREVLLKDTTSLDVTWVGLCAVDTRGLSRAQSRVGSTGAILLASSQRYVALYDPIPAVPRALRVVGRGILSSVQRDVAYYPQDQLLFVSFTQLTLSPLSWSSQGVDFY